MNFEFSAEQNLLREQARGFLADKCPLSEVRRVFESDEPYALDLWRGMADMGWTATSIPEAYGGIGLGYLELCVIAEELGRSLAPVPFASTMYQATEALLMLGNEAQKQQLLPKVVDGSEILTLAVDEQPRHSPSKTALAAQAVGGGYQLNGSKTFVLEGMAATTFVVAARTSGVAGDPQGISLFLVPAASAGVQRSPLHTVDSRGYAQVKFTDVAVDASGLLGELDAGYQTLEATLDRACAGIAAEMLGTGAQAFDMALEYLKTREQFGRVIGSFQALGHRAADLFSAMEMARSCSEGALQAIDAKEDNIAEMASLAKCRVGDFLHEMSNQVIQIHGGIGMTDEFDAGFYLKRARVLEALYGNQAYHRDRYARALGF